MQRLDGGVLFSPHDLINFMQCEFITWMDRRFLDDRTLQPDEDDESVKILQKKGIEHEVAFLEAERKSGKRVIDIAQGCDSSEERLRLTVEAMRAGFDIIYQGQLRHGAFGGISDFLYKQPGASKLGDYHYDVRDTKLAKKSKPEFVIQLCCYAELLEAIQGRLPERVAIVLGSGEVETFRSEDYFFYYLSLKEAFLKFIDAYDVDRCPDDVRELPLSRWNSEARRIVEERDALSQVANIRQLQIRRLRNCGIETMGDLAKTDLHFVPKIGADTFNALKEQARLQVESRGKALPVFAVLPPPAPNERKGLAILPPDDPYDVWFDMEGYPHVESGLEYLFGATHCESGSSQFADFWAHDRLGEKLAFEQFIDWVYARFKAHPDMHIYHYASYEVSAVRRLMGRHGTRELEVDELLRNEVFVDLYQIVRHALRVGEPSYSIKNIEHLYRGKRAGGVATATDSIVFYERWLVDPDGADWRSSKILSGIRDYNRADCESTMELTKWLRGRQKEAGVAFVPKKARAESIVVETKPARQLPEDPVSRLLVHLLDFHKREAKPFWWNVFDRLAMTQEELIDDNECLGGLARTSTNVQEFATKRANWKVYEYEFDPAQDTKLAAGMTCCLSYDMQIKTTIEYLDREKGLVAIKLRAEQPEPRTPFGLILFETYNTEALENGIAAVVEQFGSDGTVPQALSDFLYRRLPNVKGLTQGQPLLDSSLDLENGLLKLLLNLDKTTLCIQGPPGSGKTTTSAKVIRHLLRKGFRIGITSNSHKSIEHLLNCCAQVAVADGIAVYGAKIGADADGPEKRKLHPTIQAFEEKLKVFPPEDFNLIGGTAYAFCIEPAIDAFDFLFVDEAGQVSIANLVAMSRCARNIILIGDQMQLEQPIQGFHPEESGMSTLEYYMRDCATISDDRGVFLGTTFRMHPDVCALISNAVYEGKLHSAPDAAKRVLSIAADGRYIKRQFGILFVPVDHDGNSQSSEEEALAIKGIVEELLRCSTGGRKLTLSDILVVAPYNAQVRALRERLPADARVGSVDKFQGQEAPVVILSMCTSDANASPRGLPFIFSRSRLNVAISRAQSLAIVVASPKLARTNCTQVEHIALTNFFCRIMQESATVLV